ncbi:MAG: HEAT repeat domain-containing protein [Bryobacteraceae bacterium]|jgi:tetratricopeptide (TPR) repeat protein
MRKWILILAALAAPLGAQMGEGHGAGSHFLQRGQASDDRGYEQGQRALDARRWDEALARFAEVAARKGGRADGAFYWKAYALNRLNRREEALRAIEELRKDYPASRWLDDAKALELEVRQAAGEKPRPEAEADEDLKLMALNSLGQTDPERAVPLLEKFLNGAASPKLKERALFVLAQSDSAKARDVLAQVARGRANPDLQLKAIHYLGIVMSSAANRQLLGEIYAGSDDLAVKRAILRSFMVSGDHVRLLATAKTEKSAELRKEAIRLLGVMGPKSGDALASLYASETDPAVRKEVVNGLFIQGNAKALIELARKETNPETKKEIVNRLSVMHSKEAADYMMEILNK